MAAARFEVVLLETRHVKATLSAMVVKTDRKDARGIAQLLRMGWFRPVHAKSPAARETRALLVARKFLQAAGRRAQHSRQSAVDDPGRFAKSRAVGAHFGLTLKKYQAGETDVTGGISRVGDAMVPAVLYEASYHAQPGDTVFRPEALGPRPAKRRGLRAKVALARKLATVLHRMWLDGADFRWGKEVSAAA